jgi:hypothetical protein
MEKPPTPEAGPKDISSEFLQMRRFDFQNFANSLKNERFLKVIVDAKDLSADRDALDLKIFLEDNDRNYQMGQKRMAIIRMTQREKRLADSKTVNAIASGVKWERVPDPATDEEEERMKREGGY